MFNEDSPLVSVLKTVLLGKTGAGQNATFLGRQEPKVPKVSKEESKYKIHFYTVPETLYSIPRLAENEPKSVIWFMRSLSRRMLKHTAVSFTCYREVKTLYKLLENGGTRNYILQHCSYHTKLTELLTVRGNVDPFLLLQIQYDLMQNKSPQKEENGNKKTSEEETQEKVAHMHRSGSLQAIPPFSK